MHQGIKIKAALANLSNILNDTAKKVKQATLKDQLIKARTALYNFLHCAKSGGTLVFKAHQDVWPNSHSDLERAVYSMKGIAQEVKGVLSAEYISSYSAIKLLCVCPNDVFDLLLAICTVETPISKDTPQVIPLVNSTKSIQYYTLNYCPKQKLLAGLQTVLEDLQSVGKKATKISHLAQQHLLYVNFNKMINTIVEDLSKGDKKSTTFIRAIGPPNAEGFFTEDSFEKVFFNAISF